MHEMTAEQRTLYLRRLLQRYGTLSLPLGSGLRFSLIQVYQPLRLRQSTMDEQPQHPSDTKEMQHEPLEDEGASQEVEAQERALEVLAENGIEALSKSPQGRLVILGGPGTGKTTVLKHLLCHHAHLALENTTAPLPIFLSLPELARAGQDLDAYCVQIARDLGLATHDSNALLQAIQQGRAFVCLDSLDEVLPHLRAGIIRQINQLAGGSGNTWIVGSRFTDYKGGQFQHGHFQEWELQTLDEPRRQRLATQLLPELHRQLAGSPQSVYDLDPHDYVRALREHRQAATWGENPLLFSLGAVVYLRRGHLAGSRALLYREVIDAVLETREHEAQQRVQLRHILADLALELYQIKGRTFSAEDLRATLINLNTTQRALWDIEETYTRVLNAGLLDVVAYETYSFRHQTFQEYLVASALARRFMSEDKRIREAGQHFAWRKHTYSRWNEIERLLVGILVQEYGKAGVLQARAWLERLLQQQESPEGDPGNLSFELAIKLLGEVAELDEWQTAETLELEEKAAATWVRLVRKQRLQVLAPEIGYLRPSAQEKALAPLFTAWRNRGMRERSLLGAMRSRLVAERVRAEWQAQPAKWSWWSQIFDDLQAYAPVDLLLPLLQTETGRQLEQATWVLQRMGTYAPVPELIALLTHERVETRQAAQKILIEVADKADIPVEPLLALCRQDGPGAFEAACVLARQRHPAALEPLLARLSDGEQKVRSNALGALSELGTLVSLHRLLACLDEDDPLMRKQTVEALGKWGQDAPLEPLLATLKDPDLRVRRSAIETLDLLRRQGVSIPVTHFTEALADAESFVVAAAIQALNNAGRDAPLEPLLVLLHSSEGRIANAAFDVLTEPQFIERVPEEVLWAFYHENKHLALSGLGKLGQRLPQSFWLQALKDTHPTISAKAACALGQRVSSPALDDLLVEIGNSCSPLRETAVMILAHLEAERALPLLLTALCDEAIDVSRAATQVLSKMADRVPPERLFALLQHPSPQVRQNALHVLARRQNRPLVEPLIAALHDSHADVRAAAVHLFATWTEDALLAELVNATLDAFERVRLAAARTLGNVGRSNPALAQEGLLQVLRHPVLEDLDADHTIKSAFAAISPSAPSEPLLQALFDFHSQKQIRRAHIVAHAVATQGERIPVAVLREMLHHPEEARQLSALFALSGAGSVAPIDEIVELLDGPPQMYREVVDVLIALAAFVPETVFWRIWYENAVSEYTGWEVLQAIKTAGGTILVDILSQIVQRFSYWTGDLVAFLGTLEELSSMPPDALIVLLATMRMRHLRHTSEALEKTFRALVPRFPLSTWLEGIQSQEKLVPPGVLLLSAYHPEEIPQETLLNLLDHPSPAVRTAAIECLCTHSSPLPVETLLRCLPRANQYARTTIIHVLETTGTEIPIDVLLTPLKSADPTILVATLTMLSQPAWVERVPVDAFLSLTGDARRAVRKAALKALKEKDQPRAIECCLGALGDTMEPHRDNLYQTPLEILQEIAPELIPEIVQEARTILQGGPPERFFRSLSMSFIAKTIEHMERPQPELLARLGELLDWPHWEVRMKAAQALGKLRRNIPDATIRRLMELRRDPHSRAVRETADEALAEILSLETGIEDD